MGAYDSAAENGAAGDGLDRLEAANADVLAMLEAWREARGDALVPLKTDFDPLSVPRLLRTVWLYRYEPDEGDFVCRLAGEAVEDAWGGTMQGRPLRDIVGADKHPRSLARWRAVVETPLVQYAFHRDTVMPHQPSVAERLVLPLAEAPGDVRYTIGISLYPRRQDTVPDPPPLWDDIVTVPCRLL